MNDPRRDLERLLPHLIEAWRKAASKGKSGGKGLGNGEIMEVALKVRELSRGLTREREFAGSGYFADPSFLGAYLLHFWPASYVQARLLLAGLEGRYASVLDLGSGPGPMSLALLDAGAVRVLAADQNPASLLQAKALARAVGRDLETKVWDAQAGDPLPEGSFDLVILGHLLNELWRQDENRLDLRADLAEKAAERLEPGGAVLIVEPALRATTQELLRLRDNLLGRGFRVLRPCVYQGPCPALPDSVCHAEFDWTPPGLVREIARRSRVSDREDVKASYLLLEKARPGQDSAAHAGKDSAERGPYRVVSEGLLSKSGRLRYLVCGTAGRFPLSAKKEGLPGRLRLFTGLKRGDLVAFTKTEARESGLGLTAESELTIVKRRGSLV